MSRPNLPPVSDAAPVESTISSALALRSLLDRTRRQAGSRAVRETADRHFQDLDGMLTDLVTELRGAMQAEADEAEASGATAAERDRWQSRYHNAA